MDIALSNIDNEMSFALSAFDVDQGTLATASSVGALPLREWHLLVITLDLALGAFAYLGPSLAVHLSPRLWRARTGSTMTIGAGLFGGEQRNSAPP